MLRGVAAGIPIQSKGKAASSSNHHYFSRTISLHVEELQEDDKLARGLPKSNAFLQAAHFSLIRL